MKTPVALTIAGSDPSGGAGLQADLKTFHRCGVYGEAVVTLITVQNTRGILRVETLAPDLVTEQIRAVVADIPPAAAKTGALGNDAIVQAVAEEAQKFAFPLVVDPVMISKHGVALLNSEARKSLERLIRHAFLVTPNLDEASILAGFPVADPGSMRHAAQKLAEAGVPNVLVKGGHLHGPALDILYTRDSGFHEFVAERIDTPHTHGTGCALSAAITAELARGEPLLRAVEKAKAFVTLAIRTRPGLGGGFGPLNHHAG